MCEHQHMTLLIVLVGIIPEVMLQLCIRFLLIPLFLIIMIVCLVLKQPYYSDVHVCTSHHIVDNGSHVNRCTYTSVNFPFPQNALFAIGFVLFFITPDLCNIMTLLI